MYVVLLCVKSMIYCASPKSTLAILFSSSHHFSNLFYTLVHSYIGTMMTYDLMTYDLMTYDLMTYDQMTYDLMTYDLMTYDLMTYDLMTYIRSDDIRSDDIRSDDIRSDGIRSDTVIVHNYAVHKSRGNNPTRVVMLLNPEGVVYTGLPCCEMCIRMSRSRRAGHTIKN